MQFFSGAQDVHGAFNNSTFVSANSFHQHHPTPTDIHSLLRPIPGASHTRDRNTSPPNSVCFPGTRVEVVDKIVSWASEPTVPENHVFVLHGYAGCGKSSISQKVSERLQEDNELGGSFFFFRGAGARSTMDGFAATLASQLASKSFWMHRYIKAAIDADRSLPERGSTSLKEQLKRLVYKPFQDAMWWRFTTWRRFTPWRHFTTVPFVIVIDGLDECEDKEGVEQFIDSMLEYFEENPSTLLRFFITTRVEQHIHNRLKVDEVHLEDLAVQGSRNDIILFLQKSFGLAAKRVPVIKEYVKQHGDWPNRSDTDKLVDHIDGSFILASGLSKYILGPTNDNLTPMQRLPLTLSMNPGLDGLYSQTLARSQHLPHFFEIVASIALLEDPLPVSSLATLLGLKTYDIIHVLVDLQAIIQLPGTDEDKPITLCHTSLRDFLKAKDRSQRFFVPPRFHIRLAYLCFNVQFSKVVNAAKEVTSNGLEYAIKYGHIHWSRYWSEQNGDPCLEEVRQECAGPQHELFVASGLIQSLVGIPTLRPSIREYMTLNWPKYLASALDLNPSMAIDPRMTKIPIGCSRQKLESTFDTDAAVFSLSAHLFDALRHNVELVAGSVPASLGQYSSSLLRTGLTRNIQPWEHGDESTASTVLALRVPWRDLSPFDIFEIFRSAVMKHHASSTGEDFRLVLTTEPWLTDERRELEVVTIATARRSPFDGMPSVRRFIPASKRRVAGNL